MGVTRKFLNWYARLSPARGKSNPPYEHIVQLGDPRLRKVSELVPLDKIKTNEIQTLIKKLEYVTEKYGSLGMSAPQIGVNVRIIVMRHTMKQIATVPKQLAQLQGMEVIPFTVSKYYRLYDMRFYSYRKHIHIFTLVFLVNFKSVW